MGAAAGCDVAVHARLGDVEGAVGEPADAAGGEIRVVGAGGRAAPGEAAGGVQPKGIGVHTDAGGMVGGVLGARDERMRRRPLAHITQRIVSVWLETRAVSTSAPSGSLITSVPRTRLGRVKDPSFQRPHKSTGAQFGA